MEIIVKMQAMRASDRKPNLLQQVGFTLIELSIVLVIIGLIVGGVLVGQDLIKAAEIRATISQYEKYNSAMNTFRSKYNALPGDMVSTQALAFGLYCLGGSATTCTGGAGLGDGNGLIEGGAVGTAAQLGEPPLMWRQLSDSSLIDGSFGTTIVQTSGAMTTAGPTAFYPPAKLGRGNYWVAGANSGQNYYLLALVSATSATDATITAAGGITPVEAYNIDSKLDDGSPNTGIVQARGTATAPNTLFGTLALTNSGKWTSATAPVAGDCMTSGSGTSPSSADTTDTYARGTTPGNTPACTLRMRFN